MSSLHHGIIAAIVPAIVKKAASFIAKKFKLAEFDEATKTRVSQQAYPAFYGFLYGLWIIVLLMSGLAVLGVFFALAARFPEKVASYLLLGTINMIGGWFVLGALLDAVFWRLSSEKFRDYMRLKLIKSNSGYAMEEQVRVLLTLGGMYYLVLSPVIIYLLFR